MTTSILIGIWAEPTTALPHPVAEVEEGMVGS